VNFSVKDLTSSKPSQQNN